MPIDLQFPVHRDGHRRHRRYERVGLRLLRRGWLNIDLAWSLVLIASGAITLFTAL